MNTLIGKLFKSRKYDDSYAVKSYESEMVDLVRELEKTAKNRGLTVSRWQNNSNTHGYPERITWAVHSGKRPAVSKDLPDDAQVVTFRNLEGKTRRSESYKQIKRLLDSIK